MRNILFLLAFMLGLSGCKEDVLDKAPVDSLIPESFFQTENNYQMAVNEMYGRHADFVAFVNLLDAAYLGVNEDPRYRSFKEKTYTENDPLVSRLWSDSYDLIHKIHSMLELLDESPILSKPFRDRCAGQLLAVRGDIYLQLSLWYGKAPLVLKKLEATDNLDIPASDRDKLLDEVIADLETALFYYTDSEYTYMNREQLHRLLIQSYALKGDVQKAATLLAEENSSGNPLYIALNTWFSGEEKKKVIDDYLSAYPTDNKPAAKLILDVMAYSQAYFGWPDNHLALLPIPADEQMLNPALTPNPGY